MSQEIQTLVDAQAAKTGAQRVTPADIDAEIASTWYFTAADGARMAGRQPYTDGQAAPAPAQLELLTFCVLVLHNGFTVVGKSACVDPAMFDAEIGRKVALADAKDQMWALMGFRLRDRMIALHHLGGSYVECQPLGNPWGE